MKSSEVRKEVLKLSECEKAYKAAYENGGQDLLASGLSYAQYIALKEEGRCIVLPESRYYTDNSIDCLGNTILEVDKISAEDKIYMNQHPRYSYPVMHNHAYIELVYVYSGTCTHFVEDRQFEMKQGDICILAPQAMHALSAASDDAVIFNLMLSRKLFDQAFLNLLRGGKVLSEFFESLFYSQNFFSPYILFPTGEDTQIAHFFEIMYAELQNLQYGYEQILLLNVQSLFIFLIRRYEMMAIISGKMEDTFNNHVVSVLGYLSQNYSQTSLKEAADFFGYAPNYLGKMLKHYTGKTYTEIITEYQMEKACELLRDKTLSVTEVGQEAPSFPRV